MSDRNPNDPMPERMPQPDPDPVPWHDPGPPVRRVNLPPDSPSPAVPVQNPDSPPAEPQPDRGPG